ncbi:hypothetical protein [Prauserella muralis]|uniref:Uncharacterized protein n=1 Tax=Prauserella muralis TaxID=588067 RepID=A0A2V4BCT0_9PSEU|nr:hypothetical protein [Prauserella muralis]PXY27419.1 hypothetical protein BAY60_13370 [Prauserella muralis]TWE22882.1 hypothetical protein FHX69_4138 [Prauserella muralis]
MTTTHHTITTGLSERDRLALCDWTRQHGVDPTTVPMASSIVLDATTVTFEQYVLDDTGRPRCIRDEHGHPVDVERTTITVPRRHPWPFEGSPTPEAT